ncbi:RNA polymerase I-specific transcription initiation factor RRN6-like protein [Xylaria digitata]|nr:RNA polymerase I-specific transcription initiation factor RRN6-like protein [Xylaria digitata]
MTERRLIESAIGLAGRLSHIPFGTDKPEDCGWRSSRIFTQNAPVFRALGHYRTWIPPEPDHVTDSLPPPGTIWEQSRRQQRWLVKNHPEASLGNQVLHDYFVEEDSPLSLRQERARQTCFFSLGELTDISLQKNLGVPLVVTVTGSANNILRLATLNQERWVWHREPNIAVHLYEAASEKPALWIEEDVGPILRVKCIVDLRRYNPTRWLAVQRDSGTTIFQPEYHKVPVGGSHRTAASRIAANPLFHISREQTGGNTHSDVSFNPATRSNPPQLAIIDERGFWSIWDVKYTKIKSSGELTPRLKICGHIDRGILEQLPYRDNSDMQWHKILWVGRSDDNLDLLGDLDLDADNEQFSSQAAFPPLQRSSSVLVCSPQQIRLLDLTAGVYLSDLEFCRHGSLDCVLDVRTTHDPQYFYVLTTFKLFIVRAHSKPGVEWDRPEKVWSILFSTPHFRSPFDQSLKLAITQSVKPDLATSLVFIYSSTNPWTDLFYVEFSQTDPNRVKCQANVTGLGSLRNTIFNSAIQTLCITPSRIIAKTPESSTQMGQDLVEKRTRLYQISVLKSDMSLASALCVSSMSSSIQISLPSKNVGRQTRTGLRRRASHCSPPEFIVDDDLVMSREYSPSVAHRYIKAFYEYLSSTSVTLHKANPAGPLGDGVSLYNPFDATHRYVENATQTGFLPIYTLLQVMPSFKEIPRRSLSAIEWEHEIERLNNIHSSAGIYTLGLLRHHLLLSGSRSFQEVYSIILEIADNSSHHGDSDDANDRRMAAISEQIAYDLYLSLHGIGLRNPNSNRVQVTVEESMLLDSQTETLPSSPPRYESPASSAWSQRSNSEAIEDEDPAMTLLRTYTGTGKFVPHKKFELLDKWQLGAEPSDYTFDLDRNDGVDAGAIRREKQLAREHRKRRRTQTLLQMSQEPELPATQPAPDTSFYSSQPRGMSSQRQIIHSDPLYMMSQPTAGTFGRRPNKKVKKRKGGF